MNDIKIGAIGKWYSPCFSLDSRASIDDYEIINILPTLRNNEYYGLQDKKEFANVYLNNLYWVNIINSSRNKLYVVHLCSQKISHGFLTSHDKSSLSNYDICPNLNQDDVENCVGSEVYLKNCKGAVKNLYDWIKEQGCFSSQVYFTQKEADILFVTKNDAHNLGGIYQDKKNNNVYLYLPNFNVNFQNKSFLDEYNALLKEIYLEYFADDKTEREVPEWVKNNPDYLSEIEKQEENKISEMQKKIDEANAAIDQSRELIKKEQKLKNLLYGQSYALEESILEAMRILGFKNPHNYKTDNCEIDVVCDEKDNPGILLIGEAEGTTKGTVNNKKINQLHMNEHTYIQENNPNIDDLTIVEVLFGNAFADMPPEQREEYFGPHVYKISKLRKTKLVRTPDLFRAALHIKNTNDKEYAKKCFDLFFDGNEGIISFPEP